MNLVPKSLASRYLWSGVNSIQDVYKRQGLKACPDREPGDDYRVFMQAISLSTSSSVVSKEVTSLLSPMAVSYTHLSDSV